MQHYNRTTEDRNNSIQEDKQVMNNYDLAKAIDDAAYGTPIAKIMNSITDALRDEDIYYAMHAIYIMEEEILKVIKVYDLLKKHGLTNRFSGYGRFSKPLTH